MAPRIIAAILLFPLLAVYDGLKWRHTSRVAAIVILLSAALAIGAHLLISFIALVLHQVDALPPWWPRSLAILIATIAMLLIGIEFVCRRAPRPASAWLGAGVLTIVVGGIGIWQFQPIEFANATAFRVTSRAMVDSLVSDQFDYRTAGQDGIRSAIVALPTPSDATFGDRTEMFAGCRLPVDESWQRDERDETTRNFIFDESSRIVFFSDNPIPDIATEFAEHASIDELTSAALAAEHDLAQLRTLYETTYEDIRNARNFDELVQAEMRYMIKIFSPIPRGPVTAFEGDYLRGFFSATDQPQQNFTLIEAVVYDTEGAFRLRILAHREGVLEEAETERWITSILANIDCSP
ncbi:MAG: hypothetical protein EA377_14090 [Phycisphaerales bacterium]|nr:MAG: hypothetical protein EA377_14090 [Phycisphaerales bacterium]